MKHPAISKDRGIGFKNVNKFINKEANLRPKGASFCDFGKLLLGPPLNNIYGFQFYLGLQFTASKTKSFDLFPANSILPLPLSKCSR
jgi:hypothetical protein